MSEEINNQEAMEVSELLQIRRDKLDELRGLGIDPFGKNMNAPIWRVTFSGNMTGCPRKNWRRSTSR